MCRSRMSRDMRGNFGFRRPRCQSAGGRIERLAAQTKEAKWVESRFLAEERPVAKSTQGALGKQTRRIPPSGRAGATPSFGCDWQPDPGV